MGMGNGYGYDRALSKSPIQTKLQQAILFTEWLEQKFPSI